MFFKRLLTRRRRPRRATRRLRLEHLLKRDLLAGDFGAISGTVFTDLADDGLDVTDPVVAGVTVTLYRDGGDGNYNFGQVGSDDTLVAADVTDGAGQYEFLRLEEGTYFVEQIAAGSRLQRTADRVVTVTIDATQAAGETGNGQEVIDTFDGNQQQAAAPAVVGPPAVNPTNSAAAPEAIGGERDLVATRTSGTGAIEIDVNGVEADLIVITASPSGVGSAAVTWDGLDGNAATLNPIGLRAGGPSGIDMTAGNAEGILLQVRSDQPGDSITVSVYTDGTNFSTFTLNIPDLSGLPGVQTEDFTVAFTDFAVGGGAGADFTNVGAITAVVSLSNNSQVLLDVVGATAPDHTTVDFASFLPLSLGNQVFIDSNNNGLLDGTETGVNGVDVMLYADTNANNSYDPGVDQQVGSTVTTSGGGLYSFTNLFPGDYFVRIPAAEFTLGATLAGYQTSRISTTAPDPDTDIDGDDNGNFVAGQGIVSAAITLTGEDEPTNDADTNDYTNTTLDFGVVPQVEVSIVKTVFSTTPVAGQAATYRLTITNAGPHAATNVVVQDTLPVGIDPGAGGLASVTQDGAVVTGAVTIVGQQLTMPTVTSLAVGANLVFDITVNVPASGAGAFNNVATVTSDGADTDPNNNSSNVDLNPARRVDLVVDKNVNDTDVSVGDSFIYTITVANNGPSTGTGVTLTDTLPTGITFNGGTITRGGVASSAGISIVGSTVTAAIGNLDVSEVVTVAFNVTASPAATGTLNNSANATANETEINAANNTDAVAVNVTAIVDLVIDKQAPATAIAGEQITYTFDISNNGPSNATGVSILDVLPTGVTFVSGTGATFNSTTPGQVTIAAGTLAAGANATVTMTVQLPANTTGNLTNAATISANETELVGTNGDNSDTAVTSVTRSVNLEVTKVDGSDPVIPGNQLVYTIEVDNLGVSTADNAVLTDTLPAGVTLVSIFENGVDITANANVNNGVVTLALGNIAPADPARVFTMTTSVASSRTGTLTNTVSVSSDQDAVEVDMTNNSDVETTATTPTAVIVVSKDDGVTSAAPGSTVTYTITVQNQGPSDATSVVVTDALPNGITLVSSNAPGGAATQNGNTLTLPFGSVASGGVATATLTVRIPTTTRGSLTNAVTVAGTGVTAGTLSASHVTPLVPDFDVTIDKTVPATIVSPGDTVAFTITVTNATTSPSAALNVTVDDTLPAGLTFVSGNGPQGAFTTLTDIPVGNLEPGQSATLTVNAQVGLGVAVGTVLVTPASVDAEGEPTAALNNNADQVALTVADDTGSIAGRVVVDTNFNNVVDPDEAGRSGVTVQLTAPGGGVTTTTTAADGSFAFAGLVPGVYQVSYVLPANFVDSTEVAGTGAQASAVADPQTFSITLGLGGQNTAQDFVFAIQPEFSKWLFFV